MPALQKLIKTHKSSKMKISHDLLSSVNVCIMGNYNIIINNESAVPENITFEKEKRLCVGIKSKEKLLFIFGNLSIKSLLEISEQNRLKDAILLDGGDSTSLVVNDEIIYGCTRKVADSLMLIK